jgi:hypothetical protein
MFIYSKKQFSMQLHSKKSFILLLLLVTTGLLVQAIPLDYKNRWLEKELVKDWNVTISSLKELPELTSQLIHQGKVFQITNQIEVKGYVYIGRVTSCRMGGCSNSIEFMNDSENFEYFDMYIIYDSNKKVRSVKVFDYQATHGHEICSKSWLKQFLVNDDEEFFEVGKNIDSISGATISVYAIASEVNYINQLLKSSKNR